MLYVIHVWHAEALSEGCSSVGAAQYATLGSSRPSLPKQDDAASRGPAPTPATSDARVSVLPQPLIGKVCVVFATPLMRA